MMVKLATKFGGTIRTLRENAGETLAKVAIEAGISISYLSDLERGKAQPSLKVLRALATVYAVRPGFLIDDATVNYATISESDIRYDDGTWQVATCVDCSHRVMATALVEQLGIINMCEKRNAVFGEIPDDLKALGVRTMNGRSHQLKCVDWHRSEGASDE